MTRNRNKNQKEDQDICWETPLEAKAGVSEFSTNILDLCFSSQIKEGW